MFTDIINRILESERDFGSNRQEENIKAELSKKRQRKYRKKSKSRKSTRMTLKLSEKCMERILKPASVLILHYRRL